MKSRVLFAVIFAAYLMITLVSCGTAKNGCPGANSQGRVPGKFKA
jgi:hypothetical protein